MISPSGSPAISIVLPVRNESETIGVALAACLDQDYKGSIQVVVADALSNDGTRDILAGFVNNGDITLVDNPARTTPAGLNAAINASTGDVIVRCDGHSELPIDYVSRAVRTLAKTDAVNVGGVQRAMGIRPVQRAIAAAMSSPFGVGDARFHIGGSAGYVDTVYLGVFLKDSLAAVGGFDETLVRNQDYELNVRLRADGGTIYFDPSLKVIYRPRTSFRALGKQYFEYGWWKRVVVRKHPGSLRWRQVAPPLLVLGMALSMIVLAAGFQRAAALIPVSYVAANAFVTLVELVRRRDLAVLLLPVAFAVMHISWGVGFLMPRRQPSSNA